MKTTLLEYAYMAKACYETDFANGIAAVQANFQSLCNAGPSWLRKSSWQVLDYQAGLPHGGGHFGFQGAIFGNDDTVVCAFKGSKGGFFSGDKSTTGYDDWRVNDVQIAKNEIPNQTHPATDFAQIGRYIAGNRCNKAFSLVGHSLGGGLAQLIGYLMGVPFVTFNGPGMAANLPARLSHPGRVPGFNMIMATDPIGNAGVHLGKTERFLGLGKPGLAHKMEAVIYAVEHNEKWGKKTLNQLL